MTENDKRTLVFLSEAEDKDFTYSQIGFAIYPECKRLKTKQRWPQGMALAGGKAVSRLIEAGLVKRTISTTNRYCWRFSLTEKGKQAV